MAEPLLLSVENGVATIVLNRPEVKNATNIALLKALREAIQKVDEEEEIQVALLKGTGGTFSSGADLASVLQEVGEVTMYTIPNFLHRYYNPVILGIFNSSKLWIAQVEGYAAGAACNLALACDFVYAADDALFYPVFSKRGLSIDAGGSFFFVQLVGLRRALELLLFAEKLPALEAAKIGLINKACAKENLEGQVADLIERIKGGPRKTYWQIKDLLHRAASADLASMLLMEEKTQGIVAQSEDAKEGVQAFLGKREPKWKGK